MEFQDLNKRLQELLSFCACRTKSLFICQCDTEKIDIISELIFNLLFGELGILLKKGKKKHPLVTQFKQYRAVFHLLADPGVDVKEKRRFLCRLVQNTNFFQLIRKLVLPKLVRRLAKIKKENNDQE